MINLQLLEAAESYIAQNILRRFTRYAVGDGVEPESAGVQEVYTFPVSAVTVYTTEPDELHPEYVLAGYNGIKCLGTFSNSDLSETMLWTEAALYAEIEVEGELEEKIIAKGFNFNGILLDPDGAAISIVLPLKIIYATTPNLVYVPEGAVTSEDFFAHTRATPAVPGGVHGFSEGAEGELLYEGLPIKSDTSALQAEVSGLDDRVTALEEGGSGGSVLPYYDKWYTEPGVFEWTAPYTGWYEVEVQGAGGAGGAITYRNTSSTTLANVVSIAARGGQSGAYGKSLLFFEKETKVSVTVGAGGPGRPQNVEEAPSPIVAVHGGSSSFGEHLSAAGGRTPGVASYSLTGATYRALNTDTSDSPESFGYNIVGIPGNSSRVGYFSGTGTPSRVDLAYSSAGWGAPSVMAPCSQRRAGDTVKRAIFGQGGLGATLRDSSIPVSTVYLTYAGWAGGDGVVRIKFVGTEKYEEESE